MVKAYQFEVPGPPVPQPRASASVMLPNIETLGQAMHDSPKEFWHRLKKHSRAGKPYVAATHPIHVYKQAVQLVAGRYMPQAARDSRQAWELAIVFVFPRKQKLPPHRTLYTMSKNDLDNLEKGVMDGLTAAGVIRDDGYIGRKMSEKWYAGHGENAKTVIQLVPLDNRGEPSVEVSQPLLAFDFEEKDDF